MLDVKPGNCLKSQGKDPFKAEIAVRSQITEEACRLSIFVCTPPKISKSLKIVMANIFNSDTSQQERQMFRLGVKMIHVLTYFDKFRS